MEIIKLGAKVDTFFHAASVQYPPSQDTMQSFFGPGAWVGEMPGCRTVRLPNIRAFMTHVPSPGRPVPAGLKTIEVR